MTFKNALLSVALLATVEAAKVFPYLRKWEFKSIPLGTLKTTVGYSAITTFEVDIKDAKSPTLFNVYLSFTTPKGFEANNVYQNYI